MHSLMSNLCSGLFAAAFTLLIGWLLELRKTHNQLKSLSLILFFEVNNHLYWLEHFDAISSKMLLSSTDDDWNKNKSFLAKELSYKDFSVLMKHFRTIAAVRKLLSMRQPLVIEEFQTRYIQTAQEAHDLLFKKAGLDANSVLLYNSERELQ